MAKTKAPAGQPPANPEEYFHLNRAQVEGVVIRLWAHDGDVFARVAVYDRYAERLNDLEAEAAAEGPADRPRRQAHYLTLWLKKGQTAEGQTVTLQPGDKIMVTGHLRDRAYSESLARLLAKNKLAGRAQSGDEQLWIGRSATHLCVEALIRLGKQ